MRYDDSRYSDDDIYVRTRPTLTPTDVTRVEEILGSTPRPEISYEQITADQDDFPLDNGILQRLETDASRTITGFANPDAGLKVIANVGTQNIVLANDNASSEDANRILCHTGVNITLNANESVLIIYDFTSTRWRTVGFI